MVVSGSVHSSSFLEFSYLFLHIYFNIYNFESAHLILKNSLSILLGIDRFTFLEL